MTKTQAIAAIRALGMSARGTGYGPEIRVTLKSVGTARAEGIAYYTDCPEDAYQTALAMLESNGDIWVPKTWDSPLGIGDLV